MDNAQLSVEVGRLSEQIRQIRVEQGLPPEPNRIEPFVSIPLSMVLIDKLEPFLRIAVKYTSVLAAGTLHRIDTKAFAQYREYAEVLSCSEGLWCRWSASGYRWMLQLMDHINAASDEELLLTHLSRRALFCIEMMRHDTSSDCWENNITNEDIDRLKNDPAAYEAEYTAALERYKTLGEDDEIE